MVTGLVARSSINRDLIRTRILRKVAGLLNRVSLTPEEGPHSYRLLPEFAGPDLWRTLPEIAHDLAFLVEIGDVKDSGVCAERLDAIAYEIERGQAVLDAEGGG